MEDLTKFSAFTINSTYYKELDGIQIPVQILMSRKRKQNVRQPVIVSFHGGGLIRGAALDADFFAQWILDYAQLHNAIIVCPDYRLLPEANGLDILSDLTDFWSWFRNSLPGFLTTIVSGLTVENHALAIGESAGGYLAIQSALSQPKDTVKAIIAPYPMLDLSSPWYTQKYEKNMFGLPDVPLDVLSSYLLSHPRSNKEHIVSAPHIKGRRELLLSIFQQGRFPELLGTDKVLYPIDMLESREADVALLPPILMYHGTADQAIPVRDTERFEEVIKKLGAGDRLSVRYEIGANHGFERNSPLETPWLQEGLRGVTKAWLE